MQTKKGLGGLRSLEENMVRRAEGGFPVFQGRVMGWVYGKFRGSGDTWLATRYLLWYRTRRGQSFGKIYGVEICIWTMLSPLCFLLLKRRRLG